MHVGMMHACHKVSQMLLSHERNNEDEDTAKDRDKDGPEDEKQNEDQAQNQAYVGNEVKPVSSEHLCPVGALSIVQEPVRHYL